MAISRDAHKQIGEALAWRDVLKELLTYDEEEGVRTISGLKFTVDATKHPRYLATLRQAVENMVADVDDELKALGMDVAQI